MENEELQNSQSIKEGELLSIANNILSLLDFLFKNEIINNIFYQIFIAH